MRLMEENQQKAVPNNISKETSQTVQVQISNSSPIELKQLHLFKISF